MVSVYMKIYVQDHSLNNTVFMPVNTLA